MNNKQAAVTAASSGKRFVLFGFSHILEDFVPLQYCATLESGQELASQLNAVQGNKGLACKFYAVAQTEEEIAAVLASLGVVTA